MKMSLTRVIALKVLGKGGVPDHKEFAVTNELGYGL